VSIRLVHGRREYIGRHGGFKIWGRKSLSSASVGIFGTVFFITEVPVEPKLNRMWEIVEDQTICRKYDRETAQHGHRRRARGRASVVGFPGMWSVANGWDITHAASKIN
jgi:hypothetical protein